MGDYLIIIKGCGQHHNQGDTLDADKIAADAVQQLKDAGQTIMDAKFYHGISEEPL